MKTYIFRIDIEQEQEEDSRWSAWIEALPGCATWGYTAGSDENDQSFRRDVDQVGAKRR